MSGLSIITSKIGRLSLRSLPFTTTIGRKITTSYPLSIRTTQCLFAEPLKKKKRLDPAIIKAREDRRKRKLEKQIRRLEKGARQLKPIEECEIPLAIIDNRKQRDRGLLQLSKQEIDARRLLEKEWSRYKNLQHLADIQMIDRIVFAQQKALDELRKESEELYEEAIQLDPMLLPYKQEGPAITPPIENYDVPDGDYQDISKKWT